MSFGHWNNCDLSVVAGKNIPRRVINASDHFRRVINAPDYLRRLINIPAIKTSIISGIFLRGRVICVTSKSNIETPFAHVCVVSSYFNAPCHVDGGIDEEVALVHDGDGDEHREQPVRVQTHVSVLEAHLQQDEADNGSNL